MTAEEFDAKFDAGEDISEYLDWSKAKRPNLAQKRVNLDLPVWMIEQLDREAKRIGVARQAIMKMFLAEQLEHSASKH
ncbi:MAG: CopG family antitoxin [Campylobacterales bacterium]